LVVTIMAAGCSSSGSDAASHRSTTSTAPTTTTQDPTATTITVPPTGIATGGVRRVAIVSDSEIAPGVAAALDALPDIDVVNQELHEGYTMAKLDRYVGPAFADHPDVFLYAGGTNDLPNGPAAILDGLHQRLPGYAAKACLVMAVPIFKYQKGTPAEVAQRTSGTRALEQAVHTDGAHVVSYLDISLAMAAQGKDFWGDGGLGELHPSGAAYPLITAALAAEIRRCPAA
jgi:hypothetical protein